MRYSRRLEAGAVIVLIGLVTVWIGVRFAVRKSAASFFPHPVTDVHEYPSLLLQWTPSGLTRHFPPSVPQSAEASRLSAFPGFLQGGAHLQLYLRLSPEDAAAVEAKFAPAATHTFQGGDTNDHANRTNGVPTTFFYTSGTKEEAFDTSFNIYVLSTKPAPLAGSGDFLWNHGESCGVAVSRRHNEVVYWAESW